MGTSALLLKDTADAAARYYELAPEVAGDRLDEWMRAEEGWSADQVKVIIDRVLLAVGAPRQGASAEAHRAQLE